MGIKSFQGKRETNQIKEKTQILVSDYMTTNLVTFKAEDSLDYVIEQLITNKISGGPVVNEKNELVGIISETDCIKHISESKYYNMPADTNNTVGKYMVTDVDTIDKNMNIFDAAFKFISSRRRRFPVIENGKLIGQLSQKDVLKAAISVEGNTW
ncbi:inosine-5-monophosphate dehydrogenase [Polaribacter sp. BM10]|uniref:CBS domain-containing protein n=1 Tax=Polaribacter sp. BM10 TaxID=1529069 RepID=UPI000989E5A9|nr:CBS domain-containing protein [Polaribacter sp. BM10]AQS94434.1 inosine-5-monophosphate dehydrogenase [Polaribacter sp. BM10]